MLPVMTITGTVGWCLRILGRGSTRRIRGGDEYGGEITEENGVAKNW